MSSLSDRGWSTGLSESAREGGCDEGGVGRGIGLVSFGGR